MIDITTLMLDIKVRNSRFLEQKWRLLSTFGEFASLRPRAKL